MNFLDSSPDISAATGESEALGESESAPLLIFRVGATLWALPALAVSEMHGLPLLSPLPETAPWIIGMFNLRGVIVPVLDLNARLANPSPPLSVDDKVVVLSWNGAPLAILAHEVRAVSRISSAQIDAPPVLGRQNGLDAPFVAGVTRIESEIVLLLHLSNLLDFNLEVADFTAPSPPAFSDWTGAELEVLHERALRLRQIAPSDASGGDLDQDEAGGEKRTPVAVFSLGGDEFAASLDVVREFAAVTSVASVPCCPPHILGLINLRGDIVTLLDVRQTLHTSRTSPPFFGPSSTSASSRPVPVVVVEHEGASVGIAVDEVRDVLYLRPEEWSALDKSNGSDAVQSGAEQGFFARGAIYQGRLLPLLDLKKLLSQGGLEVDQS